MIQRGDVYWATLAPRSGSEQAGRRPVVIVSNDGFNRIENWHSIIVVPLSTSGRQARRGPTAVAIPASALGLAADGLALCHQITTLDRAKLQARVSLLPEAVMATIDEGIKAALALR